MNFVKVKEEREGRGEWRREEEEKKDAGEEKKNEGGQKLLHNEKLWWMQVEFSLETPSSSVLLAAPQISTQRLHINIKCLAKSLGFFLSSFYNLN